MRGGGEGVSDEKAEKWVRLSENRGRRGSRGGCQRGAAAGAAGAGMVATGLGSLLRGPFIVHAQPRALRIMTWSHFVGWAYHPWFDNFVKQWGTSKGIDVTIDRVSFADIVPRATAEVAAQQGHDVYFFISPPPRFEPQVLDLADVHR